MDLRIESGRETRGKESLESVSFRKERRKELERKRRLRYIHSRID